MAKRVTTDASIFLHELDISGLANNLDPSIEVEAVEDTNYASGGDKEFEPGLQDFVIPVEGFMDEQLIGAALEEMRSNGTKYPFSWTHTNPPVNGDIAYLSKVILENYQRRQELGRMFGYSAQFKGNEPLNRGKVIRAEITAFLGSSGSSGEIQLEAIGSGEELHVAVHAIAKQGTLPTLDLILESDTTGFASPTTRVTVPQFNDATGSYYAVVAGPITDDYYRVTATLGGTTPGWKFIVNIGRFPATT